MQQIRERITYANVMSSLAVFLVLGGGAAIAAKTVLPKKSVGTKQLKANSVTTPKVKKNAITTAKIKNNAVTGAKVNESTLAQVPSSATTSVIKTSRGTISIGGEAVALEHGPLKIVVKCFDSDTDGDLDARIFISSSTEGTVFSSWQDGAKNLGPNTPEKDREVNGSNWADSNGPFAYDGAEPVSATAADGSSFNAFVGLASEKETSTCWWWLSATIIS